MNWLDIIIIIAILGLVYMGYKNGIIKAAFAIAGVIIGVILAGRFSGPLGESLGFISNEGIAKAVAFAIILVVVMIIAGVLAAVVKWAVSAILLGWVNRLGGAVFGLFLGIFFIGAILSMWVKYLNPGDIVADSGLARFMLDTFPLVLGLLPSNFDSVKDFFD